MNSKEVFNNYKSIEEYNMFQGLLNDIFFIYRKTEILLYQLVN